MPSINPDGRELAEEKQCTSTQGLKNAHGKDLDTDFFGQLFAVTVTDMSLLVHTHVLRLTTACNLHFKAMQSHVRWSPNQRPER